MRNQQIETQRLTRGHSDAAWNKDTLKAGLRWIFYNQTGQIRKGSEVHEYVSSPLMAEVLACKAMLRNALSSNIENLRVFGIVSNIKSLSDLFNSISFFFSRSKNVEADRLAKSAFRDPSTVSISVIDQASFVGQVTNMD